MDALQIGVVIGVAITAIGWVGCMMTAVSIGKRAGRGFEAGVVAAMLGPLGIAAAYIIVAEARLERIEKSLAANAGQPAGSRRPFAESAASDEPGLTRDPLPPRLPKKKPGDQTDDDFLNQIGLG